MSVISYVSPFNLGGSSNLSVIEHQRAFELDHCKDSFNFTTNLMALYKYTGELVIPLVRLYMKLKKCPITIGDVLEHFSEEDLNLLRFNFLYNSGCAYEFNCIFDGTLYPNRNKIGTSEEPSWDEQESLYEEVWLPHIFLLKPKLSPDTIAIDSMKTANGERWAKKVRKKINKDTDIMALYMYISAETLYPLTSYLFFSTETDFEKSKNSPYTITLKDVTKLTREEILKIEGISEEQVEELEKVLERCGLSLSQFERKIDDYQRSYINRKRESMASIFDTETKLYIHAQQPVNRRVTSSQEKAEGLEDLFGEEQEKVNEDGEDK